MPRRRTQSFSGQCTFTRRFRSSSQPCSGSSNLSRDGRREDHSVTARTLDLFLVKPRNKSALVDAFHKRCIDEWVRVGLFGLRVLEERISKPLLITSKEG